MKNPDRTMSTTGAIQIDVQHRHSMPTAYFLNIGTTRRFTFIVLGLIALMVSGRAA